MQVRLPGLTPKRVRNRRSTIVAKRNAVIHELTDDNDRMTEQIVDLKCKLKTTQKALQRTKDKDNAPPLALTTQNTPMKRAIEDIRNADCTPRKLQKLLPTLQLHHALIHEMGEQLPQNKKKDVLLTPKVKRVILPKRKKAKACRVSKSALYYRKRSQRKIKQDKIMSMVRAFYFRDDVSSCMPGKKDCITIAQQKKQKRVMRDTLKNAYHKFKQELPQATTNVSYTVFKDYRPRNVILVSFLTRTSCLCTLHQNMALQFQAIRKVGIHIPTVPDEVVEKYTDAEILPLLDRVDRDVIITQQWERTTVQVGVGEAKREVKKIKLLEKELTKTEFTETIRKQMAGFRQHRDRVIAQYAAVRHIKEQMPPGHVTIQMDFAENWASSEKDEIQSAYYSKDQITIHSAVVHTRDEENGSLRVKSYCYVSDVTVHTSGMVVAILKKVVEEAKREVPGLNYIHYLSDSPSSQYRNRYIFRFVADHKDLFGIPAAWHYFESGHGKGPCDGIGGVAKRKADFAVKTGQCRIKQASDLVQFGNDSGKVKFIEVSAPEYLDGKKMVEEMQASAVPGILMTHAVVWAGDGRVSHH